MTFDPYAELGVPRDAAEPEIKKAYRRRAKQTHPDQEGGDDAAFGLTKLALVVLTDPEKRRRFDNTGTVEDDKPDNVRAGAIQVIERHLGAAFNAFIQTGFNPAVDPRHRDLVAEVKALIAKEMAEFRAGIGTGETVSAFYDDVAARMKSPDDFLGLCLGARAREARKQTETFREGIKMRELALKLLDDCRFRHDEPPMATTTVTLRFGFGVGGAV